MPTLYHGTLKLTAHDVLQTPSRALTPKVGHTVASVYGRRVPPLLFATDDPKTLGWYILGQVLNKKLLEAEAGGDMAEYNRVDRVMFGRSPDLHAERNEIVKREGAVAIFQSPDPNVWEFCLDEAEYDSCDEPQIEPGDWYARVPARPTRIVTGAEMMSLIGKVRF
jgi:hypothetical protein